MRRVSADAVAFLVAPSVWNKVVKDPVACCVARKPMPWCRTRGKVSRTSSGTLADTAADTDLGGAVGRPAGNLLGRREAVLSRCKA